MKQTLYDMREPNKNVPYGTVYFALSEAGYIKIGFTTNFNKRMRQLKNLSGSPIVCGVGYGFHNRQNVEKAFHDQLDRYRSHGEWFYVSKHTFKKFLTNNGIALDAETSQLFYECLPEVSEPNY